MGVSGCGKSSVGGAIASKAGWAFIEGDDLHPAANRRKIASGIPLGDDDRWPWLDSIAREARAIEGDGRSVVVACSALKRVYRERLACGSKDIRFVYLAGHRALIQDRMAARQDHFMPPGLLDSQLATLERPDDDERAIPLDIEMPLDDIVRAALAALGN
ncbi:MAG: gluconokinase [Proteobacteria bacterium]|nr:gluconokinase [Pseudomonadota bacterium]